jgi:hypothetical protein
LRPELLADNGSAPTPGTNAKYASTLNIRARLERCLP